MDFQAHYSSQPPVQVLAFLESMRNEGIDFEYLKLLAYSEHLKEEVLSRNGWRWCIPGSEAAGVYSMTTNSLIPHRDVRKWLKSQGLGARTDISAPGGAI
jgi:hypothetical protein